MSFLSSIFGAKAQDTKELIEVLDATSFKKVIVGKDVLLYDVRTSKEYKQGTINNAKNVDFFDRKTFLRVFDKMDKDVPVYLFCRSGNRSNKAAQLLTKQGFTKIYDLEGGYIAWKNL